MKQTDKTEITISKIIDAAMIEFGINGFLGGTINNICKRGINKGLIYHNFKNKDDIYLKCLKISCDTLIKLVEENKCINALQYMETRMIFFKQYPLEAHIFFEAILQPQKHLKENIKDILQPFENINERIYRTVIASVNLREGVTEEDAFHYFKQIQQMFNGYFSSPAYQNMTISEQINAHETGLSKMLDFILYGIAKGDNKK